MKSPRIQFITSPSVTRQRRAVNWWYKVLTKSQRKELCPQSLDYTKITDTQILSVYDSYFKLKLESKSHGNLSTRA